ncbi:radical SAM protein [Methylobacterium ajmalii]|uniref:Radical SAM protein n=1 Tax=Methylobacterium ajmalii TaxID=2738439 RepID=A0ABV0A5R3_9HYPH
MPRIQNLRIGHATNSSSSHSIVMMRPGHQAPPSNYSGGDFGWDNFILSDVRSKMHYVAVDTRGRYATREDFDAEFAPYLDQATLDSVWKENDYIDHESAGTSSSVDRDLLLRPEVVILGGNDNEDRFTLPNADPAPSGPMRQRQDGAASVLYWPSSGFKIRLSDEPYTKARAPELVDVKITDYCPYGCFFCYQGSTKQGAHASLESVIETAERLRELGVFEVAIGGGEPMMHPQFPEIVEAFHSRGITPNVTAYGVEWSTRDWVKDTVRKLGGIGVSVHNAADFEKLIRIRDNLSSRRVYTGRLMPQHAVGTNDITEVVHAARTGRYTDNLLLLGFKNVARGSSGPKMKVTDDELYNAIAGPFDGKGWYPLTLSVDTAFLDQFPNVIERLNVPGYLTSSPEGKFSMYIDLVRGVMGPSSYCAEEDYLPLDLAHITEAFARW